MLLVPFIMCALPGWWLHDDALRKGQFSPLLSPERWGALLQSSGFSGLDAVFHDMADIDKHVCSVLVSQAVDTRTQFLREPLLHFHEVMGSLVILGGKTPGVGALVKSLDDSLHGKHFRNVEIRQGLEDLEGRQLTSAPAVVCLADLDESVLLSLTESRLSRMKMLFEGAGSVLWVTQGRRDQNPYSNMIVGLGRSIKSETPNLRLQFLDIDALTPQTGRLISEAILRLNSMPQNCSLENDSLWSTEPELVVENGNLLIPRILPLSSANDRYLSKRKRVEKLVPLRETSIRLLQSGLEYNLEKGPLIRKSQSGDAILRLTHCSSRAIQIKHDVLAYVCLGEIIETHEQVLYLSPILQSPLNISLSSIVSCSFRKGSEAILLSMVISTIISMRAFATVTSGKALMVYEPNISLLNVLQHLARVNSILVYVVTSQHSRYCRNVGWLSIHPLSTNRTIEKLLTNVGAYLHIPGLGSDEKMSHPGFLLPSSCVMITGSEVFSLQAPIPIQAPFPDFTASLAYAVEVSIGLLSQKMAPPLPMVNISEFATYSTVDDSLCLLDWVQDSYVNIILPPSDPSGFFSSAKTYMLVGLASDLGCSVAKWMVNNGAQNLALLSRAPNVDANWLLEMEDLGARVEVIPMDVTNENSVQNICNTILQNMPPIGGVLNGAMVSLAVE